MLFNSFEYLFSSPTLLTLYWLVIGVIFVSLQTFVYIIRTARRFGYNLKQNSLFTYLSRDITEIWRSWHNLLTTWLRDYVYIPLLGGRGETCIKVCNTTFVIFIISGFWHGANWTFIIWGGLITLYFSPLLLINKNRTNSNIASKGRILVTLKEGFHILLTSTLSVFVWVFFRAASLGGAINYSVFSKSLLSIPTISLKPFIFINIFIIDRMATTT